MPGRVSLSRRLFSIRKKEIPAKIVHRNHHLAKKSARAGYVVLSNTQWMMTRNSARLKDFKHKGVDLHGLAFPRLFFLLTPVQRRHQAVVPANFPGSNRGAVRSSHFHETIRICNLRQTGGYRPDLPWRWHNPRHARS